MSKYLDNKHWLVTLEIGNAENDYIVISDKDPVEDEDFCENILKEYILLVVNLQIIYVA